MNKIDIVWFRNNLRTEDNEALSQAVQNCNKILALYCLGPRLFKISSFGFKKTERFRAKFLLESLHDLQDQLNKLNIQLHTTSVSINACFTSLKETYSIQNIYMQKEWTFEEQSEQEEVRNILPNTEWHEYYDQFLFHPEDVPFETHDIPMVFTQFRKSCEKKASVRQPLPIPAAISKDRQVAIESSIPKLEEL